MRFYEYWRIFSPTSGSHPLSWSLFFVMYITLEDCLSSQDCILDVCESIPKNILMYSKLSKCEHFLLLKFEQVYFAAIFEGQSYAMGHCQYLRPIERARYWLSKTYLTLIPELLCRPQDMQRGGCTWGGPCHIPQSMQNQPLSTENRPFEDPTFSAYFWILSVAKVKSVMRVQTMVKSTFRITLVVATLSP